jgi:DNA-binding transcriptional MerR regulator
MKIGDIAARLGTTARTLRFYEEQGLVHPRRTARGTRDYDAQDEARFAALLALAGLGFPLQELKDLAGVRPASATGDAAAASVLARLEAMDAELAARAEAVATQRADLERARALVTRCRGCTERPVRAVCDRCPVSAGVDDTGVLQVVWDEPARD